MTELEAWNIVHKAIYRSTYNSKEEFEKFPEIIKRIVRSHEQLKKWAMMDVDEVNMVIESNFQRSFRGTKRMKIEYEAIHPSVRYLIEQVSKKFELY